MITRFKSIKPLACFGVLEKVEFVWSTFVLWESCSLFWQMFFAMSKCAAVPKMTNVETQPIDGKMCLSLWSPLFPVWPLRYLRGHPCTRVGIGRGPEGGEHLVTFPPPPSPIPKISNLSFFMCGGSSSSFFVMFKNLHYQVGGIRKSFGGAIWISYRPYPLLFPLTEALGLSQETQSPDRQNFSPSALYLG